MKVLILGGEGMLGHSLFANLEANFEVKALVKSKEKALLVNKNFNPKDLFEGVNLEKEKEIEELIFDYSPDVEQRYNDSITTFNSRNLKNTMTILDKYNVTYIWIDKKMKTGQVWEKENQGLLFLLKNTQLFLKYYCFIYLWVSIKDLIVLQSCYISCPNL